MWQYAAMLLPRRVLCHGSPMYAALLLLIAGVHLLRIRLDAIASQDRRSWCLLVDGGAAARRSLQRDQLGSWMFLAFLCSLRTPRVVKTRGPLRIRMDDRRDPGPL